MPDDVADRPAARTDADERLAGEKLADARRKRRRVAAPGTRLLRGELETRLVLGLLVRDWGPAPRAELRSRLLHSIELVLSSASSCSYGSPSSTVSRAISVDAPPRSGAPPARRGAVPSSRRWSRGYVPSSALCGAPHNADIGAAWKKTSREGRDYISVTLDDPSFSAAIYATLSETETAGEYALIWSR